MPLAVWSQSRTRWSCVLCRAEFHTVPETEVHLAVAHKIATNRVRHAVTNMGTMLIEDRRAQA